MPYVERYTYHTVLDTAFEGSDKMYEHYPSSVEVTESRSQDSRFD